MRRGVEHAHFAKTLGIGLQIVSIEDFWSIIAANNRIVTSTNERANSFLVAPALFERAGRMKQFVRSCMSQSDVVTTRDTTRAIGNLLYSYYNTR